MCNQQVGEGGEGRGEGQNEERRDERGEEERREERGEGASGEWEDKEEGR